MTANFYCPWCAEGFETKSALVEHWVATPVCMANRHVSNPLQSKYGDAAGIENVPGEAMLTRVRAPGCEHPESLREDLFTDMSTQGGAIGYRCGHCYTEVYFNV